VSESNSTVQQGCVAWNNYKNTINCKQEQKVTDEQALTCWGWCEWRYSLRHFLDSFLAACSNDCHVDSSCLRNLQTKYNIFTKSGFVLRRMKVEISEWQMLTVS